MPEYDDQAMFEKLVLDGFQADSPGSRSCASARLFASLSMASIPIRSRAGREAKKDALMQDAGIVRNRAKIEATVTLARIYLDLMEKGGFARHLWSFVDGRSDPERPPKPGRNARRD